LFECGADVHALGKTKDNAETLSAQRFPENV